MSQTEGVEDDVKSMEGYLEVIGANDQSTVKVYRFSSIFTLIFTFLSPCEPYKHKYIIH